MSNLCRAKYRWTSEELQRAMLHHQRTKIRRGILLLLKGFSALLLALIVIVVLAWIFLPSTSNPPFWSLGLLVAFCIYWLTYEKLNAWYWGRNFGKRPDANVQVEWEFENEEIRTKTELGEATVHWKSFLRVVETTEGFLFYPLKNFFHWLPFSAFESAECIESVRLMIQSNGVPLMGPQSHTHLQRTRR